MFYAGFFAFVILIVAAFADNMFDEKYSQPMSEKDMTLGKMKQPFLNPTLNLQQSWCIYS